MRPTCIFLCLMAMAVKLCAADVVVAADKSPTPLPPLPPREFRAAWLATVANIDWPSKPGLPVAQQKAELIALLDRAASLHFNAVCFQIRTVSDALYPSTLEPWSEYITGVQGRAPEPFYDPLALAITEAHKRGLELHAWFNPYRAGHPEAKSPPAPNHVTRTHPELIRRYGQQTILDPGEPQAQAIALAVVQDVVTRYDVDGVVIDDYFYPYPEKNRAGQDIDFPDDATWRKYGVATGMSKADWRRENVNRFIHKLAMTIKAAKPWVQFGVSPFGIWRPQGTIRGMDAYEKIFADSRKWLANGWVDYMSPQLYWSIASPQQSFPALLDWWRAQNVMGRHVWPALADYSTGSKFSQDEIPRQMQITRLHNDPGTIHYHLRSLLDDPALAASVGALYAQPVLMPASPWIESAPPLRPKLTVDVGDESAHVRWETAGGKPMNWWLLQSRVKGAWTSVVLPADRRDFYLNHVKPETVVVRPVDRLGNVGEAAMWEPKKYEIPQVIKGATQLKTPNNNYQEPKKLQ